MKKGAAQPQSATKPQQAQKQNQAAPQLPSSDEDDDLEEDEEMDDEEDEEDDEDMYEDDEEEAIEDLGEHLGFWGGKVSALSPLDVCAGDMRVLKISTAALAIDAPAGSRASLVVCVPAAPEEGEEDDEDSDDEAEPRMDEFVVVTLMADTRPDAPVELYFTSTERAQLKVVGNAAIHVTGCVTYLEVPGSEAADLGMGDDYAEGDEEDDEEDMYADDGGVVSGVQAFSDSEDEADEMGAAAVHRRDAQKAKAAKTAKKAPLPSIISELMGGGDDDDDDEDEDEDDEDDEDDLLSPAGAERQRRALKGKIELVDEPVKKSPVQKPAPTPAPKSPQQKAAATPAPKRKNEDAQTPAAKKPKTDAAAATPAAAAAPKTPAAAPKTPSAAAAAPKTPAGAFKCASCERSFGLEAALKQHTATKHAAGGAATPAAAAAPSAKKPKA